MYFCYSKYKFLKDSGTSQEFELKFTFDLDSYTKSKETWLGLGKWSAVLASLNIFATVVLILQINPRNVPSLEGPKKSHNRTLHIMLVEKWYAQKKAVMGNHFLLKKIMYSTDC